MPEKSPDFWVALAAALREHGLAMMLTFVLSYIRIHLYGDKKSGGDSTRALASLQQSVERQGDALRSIAKHTMQTAKRVEFLERWDYDGLPTERKTA
ncbi:hypothetical protein [Stutzerimonas kunmingensis]|uniref:hypothetical protein n=1 Tax=Stutzerimonas kunmingensis TaxID=1211807 RepID=UPI0035ADBC58